MIAATGRLGRRVFAVATAETYVVLLQLHGHYYGGYGENRLSGERIWRRFYCAIHDRKAIYNPGRA